VGVPRPSRRAHSPERTGRLIDLWSQTMVEWTPIEITKEVVGADLPEDRLPIIFELNIAPSKLWIDLFDHTSWRTEDGASVFTPTQWQWPRVEGTTIYVEVAETSKETMVVQVRSAVESANALYQSQLDQGNEI
jgi:hypothetical protein